ncbi:MAG: DUF5654 family protein [bacterium]|nr:DUF5654 family protein [bacterium]
MPIETAGTVKDLPLAVIKSMVSLATSGFGVVVALAWNQVIQKVIAEYIDPYLGKDSGTISLLIYAILMTLLAVLVTMQLATLQRQLETLPTRVKFTRQPAAATKTPPPKAKPKKSAKK